VKKTLRGLSKDLVEFFKIQFEFMIRNEKYLSDYKIYESLGAGSHRQETKLALKYRLTEMIDPKNKRGWEILAQCRRAVTLSGNCSLEELELAGFLSNYDTPFIKEFVVDISRSKGDLKRDFVELVNKLKHRLKTSSYKHKRYNEEARRQLKVYDLKKSGKKFKDIVKIIYPKMSSQYTVRLMERLRQDYAVAKKCVKNGYKIPL